MIGTETLRVLVSAGMSAEQILAVSEALDMDANAVATAPVVDEQAERRRTADRERKRNLRNVCGMSADNSNSTPLSPSPSLSPQTPQTHPHPHTPPETITRPRKGTRLDTNWKPSELSGKAQEIANNWEADRLATEFERFRNFWIAKSGPDAVKLDWQRTWANWILSANERKSGNGKQSSNGDANQLGQWTRAVLKQEARRKAAGGVEADPFG